MTILNDIRQALDARLATMPAVPAIAFENAPYEQVPGTTYIRTQFLPTSRRPANRGPNPQHRYQGLYVMTVCTPEAKGAGGGLDIVDALLARFNGSTNVTGVAVTVSIEYSEANSAAFLDAPFFCIPVSVAWYVYAQ